MTTEHAPRQIGRQYIDTRRLGELGLRVIAWSDGSMALIADLPPFNLQTTLSPEEARALAAALIAQATIAEQALKAEAA